jgi:hypothetical protein
VGTVVKMVVGNGTVRTPLRPRVAGGRGRRGGVTRRGDAAQRGWRRRCAKQKEDTGWRRRHVEGERLRKKTYMEEDTRSCAHVSTQPITG